jgi:hypothetical protein
VKLEIAISAVVVVSQKNSLTPAQRNSLERRKVEASE